MALSSGYPIPISPSLSFTPFWNTNPLTTGPDLSFCAVPSQSLNTSRIATLTTLLPADCGICISICALTPLAWYECATLMLVNNNTNAANPETTKDEFHQTLELPPGTFSDNVDTAVGSDAFREIEWKVAMASFAYCDGVWDGSRLGSGEEPKGWLGKYLSLDDPVFPVEDPSPGITGGSGGETPEVGGNPG